MKMYLYALKYFDRFIKWGEGAERKYREWEVNSVPLPYLAKDFLIFCKNGIP